MKNTKKSKNKVVKDKHAKDKHTENKHTIDVDINDKYTLMYPNYPTDKSLYEPMTSQLCLYKVPNNRPIRIYCDGVYDVFHYGHSRSLKQAKYLFPNVHLIAGVTSDKMTEEYKGSTLFSENERAESLKHCRYVDEVIEHCPWVITEDFILKHNIDFIAHDEAPYRHGDVDEIYKIYKDKGIFIPIMRSKGISTSKIITNIVKDYDKYVIRNIERGCTPQELNISFLQFNRLKLTKLINSKFKQQINNLMDDINNIKSEFRYANMYWDMVINRLVTRFKRERIIERIIEFIR